MRLAAHMVISDGCLIALALSALTYAAFAHVQARRARRALRAEITQRHVVEQQLREKQNFLRTIIQSEPECVKLLSPEGVVLDINPAGASLVDAESPEQLLGSCIYSVVSGQDLAAYRSLTEKVFRGESGTLEFQIESYKGRMRWLETHAVPMRDDGGNIVALLGITRDITARKQAEEEARQRQNELARVCRRVTLNEMATTLAHELNQPLCAIASYMQSLRNVIGGLDTPLLNRIKGITVKASEQTERAGHIVQRIREFASNREAGKLPCRINTLVGDIIDICAAEARQRGVTIQTRLDERLPPVLADPIQIEQVLLNLVRNAIEAMDELPAELGRLVLTTRRLAPVDPELPEMVEVRVMDNGKGLGESGPDQIFTPFFTTKLSGLGMGLSISRSIVEAHGGHLCLSHNPGHTGSTACFCLPVLEEELL